MPFAGYYDFADCVRRNADKDDPQGYCATIMRAVEKDAKSKTVSGETLHASDFAYVGDPEDPETWKLPIQDAAHARNALARFDQTQGIPAGEKAKVHAKIISAAQRYGVSVSKFRAIAKVSDDGKRVFGWASVAVRKTGEWLVDRQGDMVHPETLEKAVYEFVLKFRESNTMHEGDATGTLIESVVFTPDKIAAMGLPSDAVPMGWWAGFELHDPATIAKVRAGEYGAFSIEGLGVREAV